MISHLQMITIYVSDLERALDFYTNKLGFVKLEAATKDWIKVG